MQILSIGNSFSQDAQRYLHRIAKADGVELNTFNLYIGGCSLERHYQNMQNDSKEYCLEMNGESTGFYVSIKEALTNRDWDIVTVQQASHLSPFYDTYQPFLNELVKYVKKNSPKSKIAIHQTWSYEQGSEKLNVMMKYNDYGEMLSEVVKAYKKAAGETCADFVIPSGEVFGAMLQSGIEKVHRDTFHASLGLGRYVLGLIWYKVLCGGEIANNNFSDFDEDIPKEQIEIAKKCVEEISLKYNKN